jgi:membrane protein YqaA with SNARE-associated domain
VHRFFTSFFRFFLSPGGLLVLSGLDSSMLFFLPVAVDAALIIMVARYRDWFWAFPLLATAGSIIGATATYMVGRKIGEKGLERWISKQKLARVRRKLREREIFAIGLAAVLPPPFPLTPFVLTSGALGMEKRKFYVSLGSMRFVRFGTEAVLALLYGRRILVWMRSDIFEYFVAGVAVLAITGTAWSIYHAFRRPH